MYYNKVKIEKLIKEISKKENVTYFINESNSTNSIYVTFYCSNCKKSMRISDHKTHKDLNCITVYIGKNTSIKKLENSIKNTIRKIKAENVSNLFNKI